MGSDKGKPYYDTHVVRVATAASRRAFAGSVPTDETYAISIVAYLHDVVEDHSDDGYTLEFIREEFGDKIADAVDAVTHRKDESYLAYVLRADKNDVAREVKLADLEDNMRDLSEGQRKDKYRFAHYLLTCTKMKRIASVTASRL